MRVLMLAYEYPPIGGGTGRACRQVAEVLAGVSAGGLPREPGYESDRESGSKPNGESAGRVLVGGEPVAVTVLTAGPGHVDEVERVGERLLVHRIPVGKRDPFYWRAGELARWALRARARTRELLASERFDVVHAWSGWPSGWVARSSGGHAPGAVPYLVGLRGSDVPGYSERLTLLDPLVFGRISRKVWRGAAAVTAVSASLAHLARSTDPDTSIEIVGNGVDTERFPWRPRPASWTDPPDASPTGLEPFTILFVGRLVRRKGAFVLLRAFHELLRTRAGAGRRGDLRLLVVGDGPERPRLERYVTRNGLGDSVELRGHLDHALVPAAHRRASVFALPAFQDACPNALLEAMASGLPVVTTPPLAAEYLGDDAWTAPAGDETALAKALELAAADPEVRERRGKASRARAEARSWWAAACSYAALYERIVFTN